MRETFFRRGLRLSAVDSLRDHGPHAHDLGADGDQPEPAHVGPQEHADVSGPAPLAAGHALEVGVHGDVAQQWVGIVPPELLGEKARPAGGVHDDAGAHGSLPAIGTGEAQGRGIRLEGGVDRAMPFQHLRPRAPAVLQEHLVEDGPRHLEGLRRRGLHRGREVRIALAAAVEGGEARAPLLDEAGRADGLVDAELAENLVGPGKLRLADVEARKNVPFQDQHAPAGAC